MTITHLWRDEGLTLPLTGLCLSIPRSYHAPSLLPKKYRHRDISYEENKDGPIFNQTTSQFIGSKFAIPSCISDLAYLLRFRQARSPGPAMLTLTVVYWP